MGKKKSGNAVLTKVDHFLTSITKKDRVAILHDTDPDGMNSAAIMAKAVQRIRGRKIDLRLHQPERNRIMAETIAKLKKARITRLITTDIAIDQDPKGLAKVAGFAHVLIVDHHKIYTSPDKLHKKVIMIKPQFFAPHIESIRYCTAKMAYDLSSRVTDVSDCDWMAVAGMIGDIATDPWMRFVRHTFKRHRVPVGKKQKLIDTTLGKIAITITDAACYDLSTMPMVFDVLYRSKGPRDFLKHPKLKRISDIVEKIISQAIQDFPKKADHYPALDLSIYEVSSKYAIKSPISTILGLDNPDRIIIIWEKRDGEVHVSFRCNSRQYAMNELVEQACRGLNGCRGGGHIPAAGGIVPEKHWPTFKSRLFTILHKWQKMQKIQKKQKRKQK